MKLAEFFTDEDAVSPVIGVILMVAITVILAAVIGTFVLDLGSNIQQSAPQATFSINSTQISDGATGVADDLQITHSTGDSIDSEQMSLTGDINNSGETWAFLDADAVDSVSAGDDATVNASANSGTIRVVWNSAEGDNSATLLTFDYD